MGDILVIASKPGHALELLAKAREIAKGLGGKVVAAALGPTAASAQEFASRGADRVVVNKDPKFDPVQVEIWGSAIEQLIKTLKPSAVLIGDTVRMKDAAAWVSARLEVGCGSSWTDARLEDGRFVGTRSYYSGRSIVTERLRKDPQIATLAERAFEPLASGATKGSLENVAFTLPEPKAKLVGRQTEKAGGTNLEEAEVIVSAGRGIKKKEDLAMVEELARLMGAAVGCTRPIAADLKWLGDENWIGLSGHKVAPKAYIGLGVSGQIQHVTGMRGSKIIVAINRDAEAPLVKISDYAILDDLYKVVPELVKAVRALKGT